MSEFKSSWHVFLGHTVYILAICTDGCVEGNCTAPGICKCENGWEGRKCDERRLNITSSVH